MKIKAVIVEDLKKVGEMDGDVSIVVFYDGENAEMLAKFNVAKEKINIFGGKLFRSKEIQRGYGIVAIFPDEALRESWEFQVGVTERISLEDAIMK